ncbi:NAD(P)H-binding protein [Paenibacillus sp. LHD-38]|uniref:NAD(P)H-binding protein n=1 Tax=Paenibacillus sp. LHD-38 TaxID=3072143 RepID=UPI00280FEB25|nr:NAD(P)H-binding protein [Paenibacillus sp. LHD-38]MDQ8738117.1 NAD(P)H-binding protein [Paenibacillus sp. LHD-38]
MADGHQTIIRAMEKMRVNRFITLATPTVQSKDDRKNFTTVVPGIMAKILFPNAYREMKKIEQLIKNSELNWTVVRIINPNVKHKKDTYDVSLGDTTAKMAVSRENIGKFMYLVALQNSYVGQMPIVFNK